MQSAYEVEIEPARLSSALACPKLAYRPCNPNAPHASCLCQEYHLAKSIIGPALEQSPISLSADLSTCIRFSVKSDRTNTMPVLCNKVHLYASPKT